MRATYKLHLVETGNGRTRRGRELASFEESAIAWEYHDRLLAAGLDVEMEVILAVA